MARVDSRRARRMMKQLGMNMEEMSDVEKVILQGSGREIIIEDPTVTVIDMRGQKMYQIVAGRITEKATAQKTLVASAEPSEEDVQLVAVQAGVSPERARKALIESNLDLAKAILLLTTQKD